MAKMREPEEEALMELERIEARLDRWDTYKEKWKDILELQERRDNLYKLLPDE